MSSTVPSSVPDTIWSPIRNGRVSRMRMPASRFCRMSLNANPIATLPIPSAPNTEAAVTVGKTTASATSSPRARAAQPVSRPRTTCTPDG